MHELGVIHGRFQVLHNDHLKYLLAGKERCRHLVVGITNPDPGLTRDENTDPERSAAENNPLTYWERQVMVRDALMEAGVALSEFSVVPLPINTPELYRYYVPLDAVFFLTIYDDWGRAKRERFESLGLETCVLWEKRPSEKGISGTEVRERIRKGGELASLVPSSSLRLIQAWDLRKRLNAKD